MKVKKYSWVMLLSIPILLLSAVFLLLADRAEDARPLADRLSFTLSSEEGYDRAIHCWEDKQGNFVVFLPSYAQLSQLTMETAGNRTLRLDGRMVKTGMDCSWLSLDTRYSLTDGKNETTIQFLQSANVATLYIDTRSGTMDKIHEDKTYKEKAEVLLFTTDGILAYRGNGRDQIRGHGNSTWKPIKRPYNLYLANAADLLGLGRGKKWVLLANGYDSSNLENKMVLDLASQVGTFDEFAPHTAFVDLYLNGEYAGLYLLSEHVSNCEDPDALLQGGALFYLDYHPDTDATGYIFDGRIASVVLPDPVTQDRLQALEGTLLAFHAALLAEDPADTRWMDYVDLDSWARKYLIEEIFMNEDGGITSQYFVWNKRENRIYAGPCWDYDGTFGAYFNRSPRSFLMTRERQREDHGYAPWFHALMKKPEFQERVYALYGEVFLPRLERLVETGMREYLDETRQAGLLNQIRWAQYPPEDVLESLTDFLAERLDFLNSAWIEGAVYHTITLNGLGQYRFYSIPDGEDGSCVPPPADLPLPYGFNKRIEDNTWYYEGTDQPFDPNVPITEDITLYAKTVPLDPADDGDEAEAETVPQRRVPRNRYVTALTLAVMAALLAAMLRAEFGRGPAGKRRRSMERDDPAPGRLRQTSQQTQGAGPMNMKKYSLVMILSIPLLLLSAIFLVLAGRGEDVRPLADSLSFTLSSEEGYHRTIHFWEDGEGEFVVFLPSYAQLSQLTMKVIGNRNLQLDGRTIESGMDCSWLALDTRYSLTDGTDGTTLRFLRSANVATLYVDTRSGAMDKIHEDKTHKEKAEVLLFTAEGTLAYQGSGRDQIRGHGNSTWGQDKNPYNLYLANAADLLGLGRGSKWVLLANRYDTSNLQNKMILDLASQVGTFDEFAPHTAFVDLYLNGEYAGLYLLSEHVSNYEDPDSLFQNGTLFFLDYHSGDNTTGYAFDGRYARVVLPNPATRSQLQELEDAVLEFHAALLAEDPTDTRWMDYVDLDSWARKYLIEEVFLNCDGGAFSDYHVWDKEANKFYAGPCWDYDDTFGAYLSRDPRSFLVSREWAREDTYAPWFHALTKKPEFQERVRTLYREVFLPRLERLMETGVQEYLNGIRQASLLNQIRWDQLPPENDVKWMMDVLTERLDFLNSAWIEGTVYHTITLKGLSWYRFYSIPDGEDGSRVPLPADLPLPDDFDARIEDNTWYYEGTDQPFDPGAPVTEDITLYAKTVPLDPAEEGDGSAQQRRVPRNRYVTALTLVILVAFLAAMLRAEFGTGPARKRRWEHGSR